MKEQVKVRHILIAVPAGSDAKTDAAAKAKAEDLLKQIKSGGNFADLASKNSDDPGSKTQGGELGGLTAARPYLSSIKRPLHSHRDRPRI